MRRRSLPTANCIGILLFLLTAGNLTIHSQGFSPQTVAKLQAVLEGFQNNPENPYVGGMAAAIKVDDLAFWQGATGYAARNVDDQNNLLPGGTPFTTSTLSRIYSVTKTFTAALVLELSQQRALSLDAPVSSFLPLSLINPQLDPTVTIRQLLAHESGYSDFLTEVDFQIAVAFQPTKVWTPFEAIYFAKQIDPPATVRRYSSTNYIILGAIIEAATGKPVEQHFREQFFNPLGLQSMYLAGREPIGNRGTLAAPHDNISALNPVFHLTGQPTFPDAYTNISRLPITAIESVAFSSGGIVSNVKDLAEWGSALFGGRATSKTTLDLMLQSVSSTPDEDGDFLGYGIWRTTKISETDIFIGHDGNAAGYRSVMFYQPDRKLTLVILTNYRGARLYEVAKALYEALPDFTCGNESRKEDKILLCWNGKSHCIARPAASQLIKSGAYLGGCQPSENKDWEKYKSNIPVVLEKGSALLNRIGLTAFPNPFSNQTTFSFKVNQAGRVNLSIYDLNGRLVSVLFNKEMEEGGVQQVLFQQAGLSPGTYVARLQTAGGVYQLKVVLRR